MGKSENFLTPKAIANRIKAKGLQKLRWYCQMCQKQCRDENGFKCHCMSESHQRQMQLFAQNPNSFMDEFSTEFERGMLEIISRKARTRVHANLCYQEYIAEREHIHMNSTMWETLTDFVIYLGRAGKCEVDQTEKGWFIKFIDRDPAKLAAEESKRQREASDLDAEERRTRELLRIAKRARAEDGGGAGGSGGGSEPVASELRREADAAPLAFSCAGPAATTAAGATATTGGGGGSLGKRPLGAAAGARAAAPVPSVFASAAAEGSGGGGGSGGAAGVGTSSKGGGALAAIMEEETQRKAKQAATAQAAAAAAAAAATGAAAGGAGGGATRADGAAWVHAGIVVKVMSRSLAGGRYYKQKGAVEKLSPDGYGARVRMVGGAVGGDVLQLDQGELETVVPAVGQPVLLLRGELRGTRARLLEIDEAAFSVRVRLSDGPRAGAELGGIEYEDVCKLASP